MVAVKHPDRFSDEAEALIAKTAALAGRLEDFADRLDASLDRAEYVVKAGRDKDGDHEPT